MKINNYTLPDFIIVGVQKAGTTSIAEYLEQHPDIEMSKIKEPSFFPYYDKEEKIISNNRKYCDDYSFSIVNDIEKYQSLFSNKKNLKGEASTHNFYFAEDTIKNIKQIYGENYSKLKIIISLRDPLERAFSAWNMFVRDNRENRSFKEALYASKKTGKSIFCEFDYQGFSTYSKNIELFQKNFPEVKIVFFDSLKTNSVSLVKELYTFLHVESSFEPDISIQSNPSGKPKNRLIYDSLIGQNRFKDYIKFYIPERIRRKIKLGIQKKLLTKLQLSKKDRSEMIQYFFEDISKIESLLNVDLTQWKK